MGTIETTCDFSRDLTVVKATGKMTADDFHAWTSDYYAREHVTSRIVWDIAEADLSDITPQDILVHVRRIQELAAKFRSGGKTAIVADDNVLAFGLSRMREIYAEIEDEKPLTVQTFTSMDSAREWLGV